MRGGGFLWFPKTSPLSKELAYVYAYTHIVMYGALHKKQGTIQSMYEPFTKLSVAPESDDDQIAFDELEDIREDHELSSIVGWAIKIRALLMSKEEVRDMRALFKGSLQGRSAQNWAFLLSCAKQVRVLTLYLY